MTASPARIVRPHRPRPVRRDVETLRTPFVELDPTALLERVWLLRSALPVSSVVVPAGPDPRPELLTRLVGAGCDIEVDTHTQAWAALAAGAMVDDLVSTSTAPTPGVRVAQVSDPAGVVALARTTRSAAVVARGGSVATAVATLRAATDQGLHPAGVCVDVAAPEGPATWDRAVSTFAAVCADARAAGRPRPWWLGLRADLSGSETDLRRQGAYLERALATLGEARPRVALHAGPGLLSAGVTLVASVLAVQLGPTRQVRLDVEPGTLDQDDLETSADGSETGPCLVSGPSGLDTTVVDLPLALRVGDVVRVPSWRGYPLGGQPEVPVLVG